MVLFCSAILTVWLLCCSVYGDESTSVDHQFHLINLKLSEQQLKNTEKFGEYTSHALSYIDGQWVAKLYCTFDNDSSVDISWHYQDVATDGSDTLRRIDEVNRRENEVVSNSYNNSRVTSLLQITDFNASYVGLYTCLFAQISGYYNITSLPNFQPLINSVNGGEIVVDDGVNVTVTCSSFPGANLYWRLPQIDKTYNAIIDENDDGSTTTLTFTPAVYHTSNYYQCCSGAKESSGIPSACTNFSIIVEGSPVASMDVSCVGQREECLLSCTFFSYPTVDLETIIWSRCDSSGTSCDNFTDIDYKNKIIGSFTVQTILKAKYDLTKTDYICSASNVNGNVNRTRSVVSVDYFLPFPIAAKSFSTVYSTASGYSALITCAFSSNPKPDHVIYWFKQELNGRSDGLEMISESSDPNINITETTLETLTTFSFLLINNYRIEDKARYVCLATNEMGAGLSKILEPTLNIDEIKMDVNDTSVLFPGKIIQIECAAHSFPPPVITWNIISEFPFDFKSELTPDWSSGNSSSTVTFEINYSNNFILFECLAYNEFSPDEIENRQLLIHIDHSPSLTGSIDCLPEDFANNNSCTMSCDFQSNNITSLRAWQWRCNYKLSEIALDSDYIKSAAEFVPISDGTNLRPITPYRWRAEMTLTNYSAWNYQCWSRFEFNNSKLSYYSYVARKFRINNIDNYIGIGETCSRSEDCATLNANCYQQKCQCRSPNYIPFDDTSLTLECLPAVSPGGSCTTDKQCSESDDNYFCDKSSVCQCGGVIMTIAILDRDECIKGVKYGETCKYDEECKLADLNTYCEDICVCSGGYTYNGYSQQCYVEAGSMSTTAIVVISISCCLVAAITFTVFAGIIRRRRNTTWIGGRSARSRSQIISEISGVPYEHMDDFNVPRGPTFEDIPLEFRSSELTIKPSTSGASHSDGAQDSGSTGKEAENDLVTFY